MVQKTKRQPTQELNLEEKGKSDDMSKLDLEVAKYDDPKFEEEGKKKLHEISKQIESLAQQSRITLKKIMQESGEESGIMNKFAHIIKRLRDKAKSDGSSAYNSISFLSGTIRALEAYREEIPVHISNFQNGINTLRKKKLELATDIKTIRSNLEGIGQELAKMSKAVEKEKNEEKREILKIEQQDVINKLQNTEIKGNKKLKDLENLNNTTEIFLQMKGGYEILLKQVQNLATELIKHKKILEIIGPSVAEVRKVVLTIDKFTGVIGEYRARDNKEVRLTTEAIKELTPAIQNMERPWFNDKTRAQVKKNVADAKDRYNKHFGHDITKLEDYKEDGSEKSSKKEE